jgi:cytidylate kinase
MKPMIIAIDGPSGAGKSTLGKMLAHALGALYIDTGAMYRAVALAALEADVPLSDPTALAKVAERAQIGLIGEPSSLRVMLNGRDVTQSIRADEVTSASSIISTISEVRRILVERQRQMASEGSVVLDGRDIGTVVFPEADFKFFLTANPQRRALRRFEEELERKRGSITYEETLADLAQRDHRDSTRADSPLIAARDAIVIDSTELSIDQVFDQMMEHIRGMKKCSPE